MNEITIMAMSAGGRLLFVLVAMLMAWAMLRLLDRLSGRPFREAMNTIRKDSRATALYYGMRLLAVGIAVGLVFS